MAARNIVQSIPAGIDPDGQVTAAAWDLAMLERNFEAAENVLSEFRSLNFPRDEDSPETLFQGRTALAGAMWNQPNAILSRRGQLWKDT